MDIDRTIAELSAVPAPDRLRLIAAIWDSLDDREIPPVTEPQKAELDRRLASHRHDPSSALCEEELEQRLTNRLWK